MKKFLSVLLSVVILFTISAPTFAFSINTVPSEQTILSNKEATSLNLVPTKTDSVYQAATGEYFIHDRDFYVAVERTDIPLNSPAALQAVVNSDDFSPRLKASIQNYYEYAVQENIADETTMTLYSSPGFTIAEEGSDDSLGKEMRYQVLDYGSTSIPGQRINSGLDTFTMADSAVNLSINSASLAVIGLGLVNVPISTTVQAGITGVSAAKSILDIFRAAFPNKTFTGTTEDFAEITFHYDYYEKYVTVKTDNAGWTDALTSGKACIDLSKLRVCLYDEEELDMSEEWYELEPFTVQGENYEDPWQAAYDHMFLGLFEPACIEVGDLTYDFGAFIWE